MSSKKEEERNEKIIRGLMKLPPNRRCINCNSLGPQYVCTNFWTFVCMSCGGIHREFTHRVKSVSMSKFTSQEVEALQEGGNQRARETYLKGWDPRQQRLPDSSNAEKVREFIKSVYVDRKYYSAKPSGKPPRDALNHRNNEDDSRRASSYHSYSQSPPYDYQYEERRYGKQAPALTRKPGSDRGILRFFSSSRLSDHVQEDRFENELHNARVSDSSVNSGGLPFRSDAQSPASQRDFGFSSPSSEKSRDILSEDGQQSPPNTFLNLKGTGELHQRTRSSDSIGQMNTGGTGFKLVDYVGKELSAPTPEKSVVTHNNKDLAFPSLSNSSESGKFDGLDLFSATCQPQVITSAPPAIDLFQLPETYSTFSVNGLQPPHSSTESTLNVHQQSEASGPSSLDSSSVITSAPSALDLFQSSTYSALSVNGLQPPHSHTELTLNVHQQSKAFGPPSSDIGVMEQQHCSETVKDKSPDMVIQKNEGWATFDMPWHVEPINGIESLAPTTETSTSDKSLSKLDQDLSVGANPHWFSQDFSANLPSSSVHSQCYEGLHNIGVPTNAMDNQSWSSFEGSISPLQIIYTQSKEQVTDPSVADPYLAWEMSEDLQNAEIKKAELDARPPFHSTSSHAIKSFDASFEHPLAAVHSHGLEQKSRNPFDIVYDSVPESSSMQSLDMSSLQSALPNHSMPTPWFPASTAIPYIPGRSQDAVVFLAAQAPSIQIPNIPSQSHVASISGNPFA